MDGFFGPIDADVLGHAEAVENKRPSHEHRCGWGACSQCECQAFMGNGTLCGNCNHNFDFH